MLDAPLYKEVMQQLTHDLARGEWRPGEALPSESRLAERFKVSIGTLRKAIDALVAQRAVVRRQGRGTFVATHNASRQMFHFFHIVPREGAPELPVTRTLAFARGRADAHAAAKLGITEGDAVLHIRNLLLLGDRPVVLDALVLPQARFPGLTRKLFIGRENTIYQLYQERYGIHVLRTSERLRATLADASAAKLLGVQKGASLLEINRIALTYHDAPVELRRSLVDTVAHEYFSDLGRAERT